MDELFAVLMGWAATLSGVPIPAELPPVVIVEKAWLDRAACGGSPCKAMAWRSNEGVVYLDERLDPVNNLYHASIVVHEFRHELQAQSGAFKPSYDRCLDAIDLERDAYAVQQAFLTAYGVYQPVGLSMHLSDCE